MLPLVYNFQFNVLDLDKLQFKFDKQFESPQLIMKNNLKRILLKSIVLTIIIVFITAPFMQFIIWKFCFPGFQSTLKLAILTFLIILNFEFINLAFDSHMTMGCLHKGKPISALSSTPMETLVNGLQSKNQFTKLTAFQELAYRATSMDSSLRMPIYNYNNVNSTGSTNNNSSNTDTAAINATNNHNTNNMKYYNSMSHGYKNIWSIILKECLSVIYETNENVNDYLVKLNNINNNNNNNDNTLNNINRQFETFKQNENIFGNSPKQNYNNNSRLSTTNFSNNNATDINYNHKISLHEGNILLNRHLKKINLHDNNINKFNNNSNGNYIDSNDKLNQSILTHDTKLTKMIKLLYFKSQDYTLQFFFPNNNTSNSNTTANSPSGKNNSQLIGYGNKLSIFEIWYFSKERIAKKLIPIPNYHAESIISIMGFLINSLEESPRGNIVGSVNEILVALERSIAILGKFTEYNSIANDENNNSNDSNNNLNYITILYELSINAFLEIVLKYNTLLNDVHLEDDVQKLCNWVLEMCQ